MKLYHVSYDKISRFVLRVPKDRLLGEDGTVPRICLSISIENCINAKPNQADALYLAREQGIPLAIYVYEFDTEDIPEGKLVEPEVLYEKYDVLDAIDNREYWLLDDSVPFVETRYESVGGRFLPADDRAPYAEVLSLDLVEEKSPLAERLEKAVLAYNLMTGKKYTVDLMMVNLADEIGAILAMERDAQVNAHAFEKVVDQKKAQRIQEALQNTEKYLEKISGKSSS